MRRIFSRYALNIFQLKLDEWPHGEHTHNFYELILIEEGSGTHRLNNVSFSYQKGDVFLLTPEDSHSFEISTFTVFTYVKFTEQIFLEKPKIGGEEGIERMLFKPNIIPENIIKNDADRLHLFSLVAILLDEFNNAKMQSRGLMLEIFGAIILIVVRNLNLKNQESSKVKQIEKDRISEILSYIRQNISHKKALSQQQISAQFNISPNYVSAYIKRHTGVGLQHMITETRLKTAERMLRQSTMTISQIATKLGFNDASHMNKMFQKYRGQNPMELRK